MRWLPLLLIFLFVYIEVSIFVRVAEVLGVAVTLLLVVMTSCIGISMVRNQGMKNIMLMQQRLQAGESPAAELVKSVSLILAGFLLVVPGFFTDFLGLLLLLPPVQKHLTLKLMPHLQIWRGRPGPGNHGGQGNVFEGEFQRKDEHGQLDKPDNRRDDNTSDDSSHR
ncbi:FxsA cytoplasmic membrane protein [Dickeya chrysanthemi Ech1591]|uniref:FxsA cytoplasmic membrane protein n=1 Tax=Dickeya chrysanthemi (strain Ech1591) TaxID=561229 RepID=C6CKH7_DICC1|nr:FxsA family protein [Dickeya chrysanthemi]ACT08342.1 FxsA cytoplasmic membrane protein [Dickeya chrysanthemi Ech1591]WJM84364.1 FxsA family protein [Dickeya chrysanthemi]